MHPRLAPLLLGLSLAACDQTTTPGQVDAGAAQHLKVTYRETDHDVNLSTLKPLVADAGTSAVLLSDVVQSALPGTSLATLDTNFRAEDGFDPASKSNCNGLLPVSGEKLAKGFVDLATRNLAWAAELQLPGCLHVKGLAQVLLADKR
jgi:hypothetical protein